MSFVIWLVWTGVWLALLSVGLLWGDRQNTLRPFWVFVCVAYSAFGAFRVWTAWLCMRWWEGGEGEPTLAPSRAGDSSFTDSR